MAGVALAYLTAKLAGSAQVTPAGLGTVEAAIIATLVATGMTAVDATGAAIIYRLISFALITIIGWLIYFWHYARKGHYLRRLEPKGKRMRIAPVIDIIALMLFAVAARLAHGGLSFPPG